MKTTIENLKNKTEQPVIFSDDVQIVQYRRTRDNEQITGLYSMVSGYYDEMEKRKKDIGMDLLKRFAQGEEEGLDVTIEDL